MSEPTVVKASEGNKPAEAVGAAPPAAAESSGAAPPAAGAEPQGETCRTAEALQQWPAVLLAVQKSRQAYSSIKQSARVIAWSLSLTEKAVGSVLKFAENKVSRLRPVIQYADKAVSDGVVAIEKKFPAVRESPEKLYDAIAQQIKKIVRPTLEKAATISEIGRKKLNRVAKKMVKTYHRYIRSVDSWLDTLEKHLNGAETEAVPGAVNEGADSSAAEPAAVAPTEVPATVAPVSRALQALRVASGAAESVAAFYVGAACWLLARAPLVGGIFSEQQDLPPNMTSSSGDVSSSSPPAASQEPAQSTH